MNIEKDLLYFCLCAINGAPPLESAITGTDLSQLYKYSCKHNVEALVCYALEQVVTPPECFVEAKTKAIRKTMLLEAEFDKIVRFMVDKGIFFMPLKGAVLKELYPGMGMRQMSDVDVYYDSRFRNDIRQYMQENLYTCIAQTVSQDAYKRDPVYNFEFHHLLFSQAESETLYMYYKNIKDKLIALEDNPLNYRMSKEDFYVYIIAHEYKHYSNFGTGIRSLLDIIILLKHYEDSLDWKYIRRELKKISLAEFEEEQRKLCKKLLSEDWQDKLSDEESELLSYFLSGSVYGDYSTGIVNRLTGQAGSKDRKITVRMKVRYLWRRLFPPMEYYRTWYPFFYKHKLLIPLCAVYRVVLAIFRKSGFVKSELDILKKK